MLCSGVSWPVLAREEPGIPGSVDALFFQYRLLVRDLLGRRCVFTPSCSHFGQQAVTGKGPVIGTMMALERWMRCHSRARLQDYYELTGTRLDDPLEVDEGLVTWDQLLLPF
jgi:hypothetical protein